MISLYLDEDSKHSQLISAIRRRGWDVVGSGEAGMDGEADSRQLEYAVRLGRPLLTGNIGDFSRLHGEWLRDGRAHPGLIFCASFSVLDTTTRYPISSAGCWP